MKQRDSRAGRPRWIDVEGSAPEYLIRPRNSRSGYLRRSHPDPKVYNGTDRTFFFVSYAGSRKRGATDTLAIQIPTAQNVAGDFSNCCWLTHCLGLSRERLRHHQYLPRRELSVSDVTTYLDLA